MKKTYLYTAVALAFAAVVTVGAPSALAQHSDNNARPGWGHGDKNHTHTGPPGHSVRPDDKEKKKIKKIIKKLEKIKEQHGERIPGLSEYIDSLIARLKHIFHLA